MTKNTVSIYFNDTKDSLLKIVVDYTKDEFDKLGIGIKDCIVVIDKKNVILE